MQLTRIFTKHLVWDECEYPLLVYAAVEAERLVVDERTVARCLLFGCLTFTRSE